MAEYISRKLIIHRIKQEPTDGMYTDEILDAIGEIPTADVVEVIHGQWEYEGPTINAYSRTKCTVCGWWTLDPVSTVYNYCPYCGAKMDVTDGAEQKPEAPAWLKEAINEQMD